jgi:hypothetical protein
MAPQDSVSQTTQQEPWTVWLTATSMLPQNGHGSSVLITYPCGTKPDSHLVLEHDATTSFRNAITVVSVWLAPR